MNYPVLGILLWNRRQTKASLSFKQVNSMPHYKSTKVKVKCGVERESLAHCYGAWVEP